MGVQKTVIEKEREANDARIRNLKWKKTYSSAPSKLTCNKCMNTILRLSDIQPFHFCQKCWYNSGCEIMYTLCTACYKAEYEDARLERANTKASTKASRASLLKSDTVRLGDQDFDTEERPGPEKLHGRRRKERSNSPEIQSLVERRNSRELPRRNSRDLPRRDSRDLPGKKGARERDGAERLERNATRRRRSERSESPIPGQMPGLDLPNSVPQTNYSAEQQAYGGQSSAQEIGQGWDPMKASAKQMMGDWDPRDQARQQQWQQSYGGQQQYGDYGQQQYGDYGQQQYVDYGQQQQYYQP